MKFIKYLEVKKYFLLLFIFLILFNTTIMSLSTDTGQIGNLLYMNLGCFIMATFYIIIGFFYRNPYYKVLNDYIETDNNDMILDLPNPQNHEQELVAKLLVKENNKQMKSLDKLYCEIKDHQDYIMSWIHEVKLPITASRLLMRNDTCKSNDYLIDKLEDELSKIDNYIEQALYYSRIDSFSKDYFITEISLNKLIKESIKKYSKLFINKHIKFTMWDFDVFIQSDVKWLGFLLDQIIANSLKYTDDGGSITFQILEDNKEKQLQIIDNGIGIKSEDLSRVFDRGFTSTNKRDHTKSTGLGLYLAKQLAVKLGHNINIESEEGKYTKVMIHFYKINNYYNFPS